MELKFRSLDTQIQNKIVFVENVCTEHQDLLEEHFDENSLSEKYSIGFNNWRQSLLEVIWADLRLKKEHVNNKIEGQMTDEGEYISRAVSSDRKSHALGNCFRKNSNSDACFPLLN